MILKNGLVLVGNELVNKDVLIKDNIIVEINDNIECLQNEETIDCDGLIVMPSLMDSHTHTRTPGYTYKEDLQTFSASALKGGITTCVAMPNLKPSPCTKENVMYINDLIKKDSLINIHQLGAITKDLKGLELSDYNDLYELCIGFSDDGVGVQNKKLMKKAMTELKNNDSLIVCHCEDNKYIIKNNEKAEYKQLRRDLKIVNKLKNRYHMCHISTRQSMRAIINAKRKGLDVSVEVCPHHLVLTIDDKKDGNTKMNPPLRDKKDVDFLVKSLLNGQIDCICSDHAPHAKHEKGEYDKSLNGIIGLETNFYIMYTHFVKEGLLTLNQLNKLMNDNIAKIFRIEKNEIKEGKNANILIFNPNEKFIYTEEEIQSKSKNTPFIGCEYYGRIKYTILNGKILYSEV
jgi:dihydroorotase